MCTWSSFHGQRKQIAPNLHNFSPPLFNSLYQAYTWDTSRRPTAIWIIRQIFVLNLQSINLPDTLALSCKTQPKTSAPRMNLDRNLHIAPHTSSFFDSEKEILLSTRGLRSFLLASADTKQCLLSFRALTCTPRVKIMVSISASVLMWLLSPLPVWAY